jgi:hypothetical protein
MTPHVDEDVDLYEYQARDLFEAHGVPVLRGIVARTPAEAGAAARNWAAASSWSRRRSRSAAEARRAA